MPSGVHLYHLRIPVGQLKGAELDNDACAMCLLWLFTYWKYYSAHLRSSKCMKRLIDACEGGSRRDTYIPSSQTEHIVVLQ